MTRQSGGDHRPAANIVTVQALAAILTLPAMLPLVA